MTPVPPADARLSGAWLPSIPLILGVSAAWVLFTARPVPDANLIEIILNVFDGEVDQTEITALTVVTLLTLPMVLGMTFVVHTALDRWSKRLETKREHLLFLYPGIIIGAFVIGIWSTNQVFGTSSTSPSDLTAISTFNPGTIPPPCRVAQNILMCAATAVVGAYWQAYGPVLFLDAALLGTAFGYSLWRISQPETQDA